MLERGEPGDVLFPDLVALGLELGRGGVDVPPGDVRLLVVASVPPPVVGRQMFWRIASCRWQDEFHDDHQKGPCRVSVLARSAPYGSAGPLSGLVSCPPIDRLSRDATAAIHLVEYGYGGYEVQPGRTSQFLFSYREFLRQPGRKLRLTASECPSCPGCQYDDVAVVRDGLEHVVGILPLSARTELRRLLAGLDAEFRRRTLHDPDPSRWLDWSGRPYPWWHRRLYVGG
ncbi:hypothetical protein SAZ_42150 [Streptomyces noursei ZPM]|nr:hypothetical protein SAZ_42150 [Streptomyces noursei ZPM]EOT04256.1 hypothetical protein K530_09578 [Streptomyces noursei CCRC 11814]EXU91160.1 hypothetical protein P354_07455 [Streptomyces noursei PD-1]